LSLNLGIRSGDDRDTVIINRKLFCEAIGIDPAAVFFGQQIHSDYVAVISEQDAGSGGIGKIGIDGADALITNVPGVSLWAFFADCVPILFYDPIHQAIGACHAGWRGTAARIAAKCVLAMQDQFGTNPADCIVGIGPSIGPCCYEVDEIVISQLRQSFAWWSEVALPHGKKWRFDLWQANYRQLLDIGIRSGNIEMSQVCTACNTALFYSYRAEHGKTGVLAAAITL
jgi:YfiH family protein